MKMLFLHPEDLPEHGAWARESWDYVVDLGMATPDAYQRWAEFFQCPVTNTKFATLPPKPIRDALATGLGIVRDEFGIDWWEVLCEAYTQRLYDVLALREIVDLAREHELYVSRDCVQARVLEALTKRPVQVLAGHSGVARGIARFHRKLRRLSREQVRQVIVDKYDPRHKIRAALAGRPSSRDCPVILLPTAYVNVSRTALAYSKTLPESRFLLVAARRSGWRKDLPPNVAQADLAAYFRTAQPARDHDDLVARLPRLRRQLEMDPLCHILSVLRLFDGLHANLRRWLVIRDAWLNFFDSEPVTSILCCDGTNPYTLLPLLIARRRGIPAILSHHGALDGHYLLKRCPADYILAKGEMERDYLIGRCRIPSQQVVIGSPSATPSSALGAQSQIVFFSEDYEASGARVAEFYRSVLPPLAKMAAENDKDVILKLHPAESLRDRRRIARTVLPAEQFRRLRIVGGPLTEDLMMNAWFAVTGISTTAVECATRGVPVFLCEWLENWPCGYLEQFAKFGVGMRLKTTDEIQRIPTMLRHFELCDPRMLWNPISPAGLDGLLHSASAEMVAAI